MPTETRLIDWPTPDALAQELATRLDGFENIAWSTQTGSTNADLLAEARTLIGPWLRGTHEQTTGRGRAGRPWQNRSGATLMFSCAFPVQLPAASLPMLSPLTGLVTAEALRSLTHQAEALRVKWPNDLQWHDAKLAGILVEAVRHRALPNTHTVVIGMGLNLVDADMLSQHLGRPIADWSTIIHDTQSSVTRVADIVCSTVNAWRQMAQTLEKEGFEPFRKRFDAIDALAGREVNVVDNESVLFSGIARGMDEQGRLVVETQTGKVPVSVGEVSIRPRTTEPLS